jgi:hypothetical protein
MKGEVMKEQYGVKRLAAKALDCKPGELKLTYLENPYNENGYKFIRVFKHGEKEVTLKMKPGKEWKVTEVKNHKDHNTKECDDSESVAG